MNWLDILFAVIIGWNAWMGLKSGLVAGLARLFGVLAGFAAALNFYRPLADTVNLKWNLVSAISGLLPGVSKAGAGKPPPADLFFPLTGPPGATGSAAVPKAVLSGLQGIGDSITRMLALGILDIICFIIIFLVVSRLIFSLGVIVGKAARLMFLGPVDRGAGLLLGTFKGVIIAMLVVALGISFQLPAAFISGGQKTSILSLALEKSLLAPYFIQALAYLNINFPGWVIW
ncbi:MAG: hypothetical protein VR68_01415 [Peptococcaceae bacterium BRH_c4a]|nr:MAG: hypothetical protein VR68_01415 [Peptococcaceae bacterium BRH_c4a]